MTGEWKSSVTKHWPWAALAGAALGFILRVTLVPTHDPDTGTFHLCLLCGELGLADFIGNVLLFMPLAGALYRVGLPGRKTIAALFVLSLSIEIAQLFVPGRESALGDVVANTVGAAAGVGLAYWLPRRPRSARSGWAAAVALVAAMVGIGLAFRPSFPRTFYYGQWTPDLGQYETYQGKVVNAELGGMVLHSWRVDDSRAVRRHLLDGDSLRVTAVAGPPPGATSPIFNVYDDHQREIVLLGADGNDLVTHVRLRATDLLLRQPDLRWRDALLGLVRGDTLRLGWRRAAPGYCLMLAGRERCGLAYTLGDAWGFVQFEPRLPGAAHASLDVWFMALLGLCAGLFLKRDVAGYAAAGVVLLAAVALPPLLGLAATPLVQLVALAVGLFGGDLIP